MNEFTISSRWLVWIPFLTVITGGVMWLTEMQQLAEQNKYHIEELKSQFNSNKTRVFDKITKQDDRLGRIEGKIDMLIHIIKEKENKK